MAQAHSQLFNIPHWKMGGPCSVSFLAGIQGDFGGLLPTGGSYNPQYIYSGILTIYKAHNLVTQLAWIKFYQVYHCLVTLFPFLFLSHVLLKLSIFVSPTNSMIINVLKTV